MSYVSVTLHTILFLSGDIPFSFAACDCLLLHCIALYILTTPPPFMQFCLAASSMFFSLSQSAFQCFRPN
jgi:hypothetical protein